MDLNEKYRPKTFDEVAGTKNKETIIQIKNALEGIKQNPTAKQRNYC